MLTWLAVTNFKCLERVEMELTPFHVIVGENDAGKSSLLQAIMALWGTPSVNFRQAIYHATQRNAESAIRNGQYQLQIECKVELSTEARVCSGRLNSGGGFELIVSELSKDKKISVNALSDISSFGVDQFPAFLLRPNPAFLKTSVALNSSAEFRFRLGVDGFGLAKMLDDIVSDDPGRFLSLMKQFCDFFPSYKGLRLKTENGLRSSIPLDDSGLRKFDGEGIGKAIYFETSEGHELPASAVSDGCMLFLAILALVHSPMPPKLLLLDEPENGIYPKRLRQLIQVLRAWQEELPSDKRPQIIMVTHSPYLLTSFEPHEVTYMGRDSHQKVFARSFAEMHDIKDFLSDDISLGEIWFNLDQERMFNVAP